MFFDVFWCTRDAILMYSWCIFGALLMHFWCAFDALLVRFWCTFEKCIRFFEKCIPFWPKVYTLFKSASKVHEKCIKSVAVSRLRIVKKSFEQWRKTWNHMDLSWNKMPWKYSAICLKLIAPAQTFTHLLLGATQVNLQAIPQVSDCLTSQVMFQENTQVNVSKHAQANIQAILKVKLMLWILKPSSEEQLKQWSQTMLK